MLDPVKDQVIFVGENNIGVLAHYLDIEPLCGGIAKLIAVLHINADDTLVAGLGYVCNTAASDMLAKEHAEIGRGHGSRLVLLCKIDKGQGGAGRHKKPLSASGAL